MGTRMLAWVKEGEGAAASVHFAGLPPELTEGREQRRRLPPPVLVTVEETAEGVFLFRFGGDGTCVGDTWHASIEEATEQAEFEYGGRLSAWSLVPPEVSDPVAYAFGHPPE